MSTEISKPTLVQAYLDMNRQINALLHASHMSGLFGNNPDPLTEDEIYANSKAGPHAWAFQIIVDGKNISA